MRNLYILVCLSKISSNGKRLEKKHGEAQSITKLTIVSIKVDYKKSLKVVSEHKIVLLITALSPAINCSSC